MSDTDKITWIIGDIHGMYDPLAALVSHLDNERLAKFVFVGDYIDHGPSSKEVLDLVMGLGDRAIPLMGNHEHLLLQTLYDARHREHFGKRIWLENGAQSTITSFGCKSFEEFEAKIDEKYTGFLRGLKLFHVEPLLSGEANLNVLITHAGVMLRVSLAEQLAANNYADFNQLVEKERIWIEDSSVWIREDFFGGNPDHWKGHLIIHGHTPTHLLNHFAKDFPIDAERHFLFLRKHPQNETVVSIGLDTGAAFGNRLTALGVAQDQLRGDTVPKLTLYVAQLDIKRGYYRQQPITLSTLTVPCNVA